MLRTSAASADNTRMVTQVPLIVRRVNPAEYPLGVRLAVAAKHATGFPLDTTAEDLGPRLAARQKGALGVWLAFRDEEPVGHALVAHVPDTNPTWGPVTDPAVVLARHNRTLVELGGLVVHPNHHHTGIGTALVDARMTWVRQHGYLACVAAWDASLGSSRLAQRYGRPVGKHHSEPITLFVYKNRD